MKIERYMKVRAARGLDILIVGRTTLEVAERGMAPKTLGYKSREMQSTPSGREWFQWWYKPRKYRPRWSPNVRWSARREGLIAMKFQDI